MLEYKGADDEHSCPYFYLWDMQGLGKLSALTTIALINDEITGGSPRPVSLQADPLS